MGIALSPSRGMVFGEESLHILSSACITVVFCKTSGGRPVLKRYLFDYPAGGALIATNYLPAVEHYFIYGKELIGFETTGELIEKVRYYLDLPNKPSRYGPRAVPAYCNQSSVFWLIDRISPWFKPHLNNAKLSARRRSDSAERTALPHAVLW
jgi:hypothetical protein